MADPAIQPSESTPPTEKPRDFADKLLEVERARQAAEQAREQDRAAIEAMRAELAAIKAQGEPKKKDPEHPLAHIKDEDLEAVEFDPNDPNRYKIAQDELWRRREKQVRQAVRDERAQERLQEQRMREMVEEMKHRFGEEIVTKGSELRQRAEQHMVALQRQFGMETVNDPRAQMLAAERAHNEILMAQAEKSKETEKQLEEYKQKSAMERGNRVIYKPGDDLKAILRKDGDRGIPETTSAREARVGRAIKSLNIYGRLFGQE